MVIRKLSAELRKMLIDEVVGLTDCPTCNMEVFVINDRGEDGDPDSHYVQDHHHAGTGNLCRASSKPLKQLA